MIIIIIISDARTRAERERALGHVVGGVVGGVVGVVTGGSANWRPRQKPSITVTR